MLDALPDDLLLCLVLPRLHPRHALSPALLAVGGTCRALHALLTTVYLPSFTALDLSPPHTPPPAVLRAALRGGLAPAALVANGVRGGGLSPLLDALAEAGSDAAAAGGGRGGGGGGGGDGKRGGCVAAGRAG